MRWDQITSRIVALLLLFSTPLLAIAEDGEDVEAIEIIDIPCRFAVGDSVTLTLTRSREQSGPDMSPRAGSVESAVRFAVTAKNEMGFVLSWRTEWDEVVEWQATMNLPGEMSWLGEFIEKLNTYELLIQTDGLGTPLGLVNVEETAALFREFTDRMIESLDLADDERPAVEALMGRMLSPQVLRTRVIQDASLYLMFTGGSFALGEEYVVEDAIANPLGGDPIPAEVRFTLHSVDRESGVVHIDYSQITDEKAVRALMEEVFREAPDGAEVLEEMEGLEIGIFTTSAYDIDLATGLPHHVEFERSIHMGPGKRIDRITIDLVSHSTR